MGFIVVKLSVMYVPILKAVVFVLLFPFLVLLAHVFNLFYSTKLARQQSKGSVNTSIKNVTYTFVLKLT